AGAMLSEVLRPKRGALLPRPLDDSTEQCLTVARERVQRLQAQVRRAGRATGDEGGSDLGMRARQLRVQQAAGHLLGDLDQVLALSARQVAWVEGPAARPVLRVAPLDVGESFQARLWCRSDSPTAVLTSATVPPRLGERLGLPMGSYDV